MESEGLEALRDMKLAFDEGLVSRDEFEEARNLFLQSKNRALSPPKPQSFGQGIKQGLRIAFHAFLESWSPAKGGQSPQRGLLSGGRTNEERIPLLEAPPKQTPTQNGAGRPAESDDRAEGEGEGEGEEEPRSSSGDSVLPSEVQDEVLPNHWPVKGKRSLFQDSRKPKRPKVSPEPSPEPEPEPESEPSPQPEPEPEPEVLVGKEVKVFWPKYRGNYTGRVVTGTKTSSLIFYKDGTGFWQDLTKEKYKVLGRSTGCWGLALPPISGPSLLSTMGLWGQGAVGWRVRVFWEQENRRYPGVVESYNQEEGCHHIVYDDGDEHNIKMSDWFVEWIAGPKPPKKEQTPKKVPELKREPELDAPDVRLKFFPDL